MRHTPLILLATAVVGVSAGCLVLVFATDGGKDPGGRLALCIMGFVVSMVWIMAIADEVVLVLNVCPFIFPSILSCSRAVVKLDLRSRLWSLRCDHWSDDICHWEFPRRFCRQFHCCGPWRSDHGLQRLFWRTDAQHSAWYWTFRLTRHLPDGGAIPYPLQQDAPR